MTPGARVAASIGILDAILSGTPAEQALTGWARHSRFAGSGDRAAVRDHVFDTLRNKLSFAALGGGLTGRALMLGQIRAVGGDPQVLFNGQGYAPTALSDEELSAGHAPQTDAETLNLPDWIIPHFKDSLGAEADTAAQLLTQRADVMLRINLKATDVKSAIATLSDEGITTRAHPLADTALIVVEGARRVRQSQAYETGLVELQDAASQAVVQALPLQDGLRVLDMCAGGGGKTLAMAARADITLFAYDANSARMQDLPMRALRAQTQVRVLQSDELIPQGPFDIVLCDVPCSGSGAWRRAPDEKWRLTQDKLNELNALQDEILVDAAALVAPGGLLAYATCSLLRVENSDRIDGFLRTHPGWAQTYIRSFSLSEGGDGFFTAHLTRA